MGHVILFLTLLSVIPGAFLLDCTNQTVYLNKPGDHLNIVSDKTDLTPKKCIYNVQVAKYLVPTVQAVKEFRISFQNSIVVQQTTQIAGPASYTMQYQSVNTLAPVNFQIIVNLKTASPNELFNISVTVADTTPLNTAQTFQVDDNFGTIIGSNELNLNKNYVQTVTQRTTQPQSYTIRVSHFGFGSDKYLKKIHVYTGQQYLGNLNDVLISPTVCQASSFSLINTNYNINVQGFNVLITAPYSMNGVVNVQSFDSFNNRSQSFGYYGDVAINHNIRSYGEGSDVYWGLFFKPNGTADIFAGCATTFTNAYRIATITPDNMKSYENLRTSGRCYTVVITSGAFQWMRTIGNILSYQPIQPDLGSSGVVMSPRYPYKSANPDSTTFRLRPKNEKKQIKVRYNVTNVDEGTTVTIVLYQNNAQLGTNYTFTSTSQTKTIDMGRSLYQEVTINTPASSKGALVQYTVLDISRATSCLNMLFIVVFVSFYYTIGNIE